MKPMETVSGYAIPSRHIDAVDLVHVLDARRAAVPRPLRDAARARVLIVDDAPTQRGAVYRALRRYRHSLAVELEPDATGALLRAAAWRPHVVVIDVYLPGIDGLEVCRRLRQHPETAGIAVVLISARMTAELGASCLQAGAVNVMTKPISSADIVTMALAWRHTQRALRRGGV
jgi:two-component system response regulator ResD